MTPVLSLRDALAQLRRVDAAERWSPVAGAPFLAVALDSDAGEDAAAARALAALPAPALALAPPGAAHRWAARFDAVVADEDALATLAAAIHAAPLAAAALVQLLRGAEARTIDDGLVAESFTYATLQGGPEHRAWLAHRAPVHAAPESAPVVEVARDGDVLRVTLARPTRRNAWSAAMRDAVHEALALALADASVERVVFAGRGAAFCAGGDLAEFGTAPDPATAHAVRTTRCVARLAAALADRLEAHVHGACVGAGVELAAFAGRVVARAGAWFALPELSMGLVPGAGGTVSLPRRIGRQRTAWLALTGARLDAATALAWGLVDALVDEDAEVAAAPAAGAAARRRA